MGWIVITNERLQQSSADQQQQLWTSSHWVWVPGSVMFVRTNVTAPFMSGTTICLVMLVVMSCEALTCLVVQIGIPEAIFCNGNGYRYQHPPSCSCAVTAPVPPPCHFLTTCVLSHEQEVQVTARLACQPGQPLAVGTRCQDFGGPAGLRECNENSHCF